MRPILRPMRSRVGKASIAARPAGVAAAIAPATIGAATYKPRRGNGQPIATHPACADAAAKPIQRPANAAKVSLPVLLALKATASAATIRTMSALVPIVPTKSSIVSSLEAVKLYLQASHFLESGGRCAVLLLFRHDPVN